MPEANNKKATNFQFTLKPTNNLIKNLLLFELHLYLQVTVFNLLIPYFPYIIMIIIFFLIFIHV